MAAGSLPSDPLPVGLGDPEASLRVFLANRPPLAPYDSLDRIHPLAAGEIADIVAKTGNHWRKIFNLYAKLMYALAPGDYASWQQLRELKLLQPGSDVALLFSAPVMPPANAVRHLQSTEQDLSGLIQVVMGKQHAESLGVADSCPDWEQITVDFMLSREYRMIGCPYFDYRQLSNEKLATLVELVQSL